MPLVHLETNLTTGHGCFPPERPENYSSTVSIENKKVVLKGCTRIKHCCGGCHKGVYTGDHSVSIEGRSVQVTGDPLTCGDKASQHASTVSVDG